MIALSFASLEGRRVPNGCKQLDLSCLSETLTRAEMTILGLVDSGLSNPEIAERLRIGVGTVKWHLHRVFEKLCRCVTASRLSRKLASAEYSRCYTTTVDSALSKPNF